jgi:5,5'-dehydrodivanillate O-demethylase
MDVPSELLARVPLYQVHVVDDEGEPIHTNIEAQDVLAWVAQGRIADRSIEALGTTDKGVILFRKMLERELQKVEAGEDPMNVIRDPSFRPVYHLEKNKAHFTDGFENLAYRQSVRWSPFFRGLCDLFAAYNQKVVDEALPPFPLEAGTATSAE